MKKSAIIILIVFVLLVLAGCQNITDLPQKDYGEYPEISKGEGYSVSGKITDVAGNGLPNVPLYVGGKIRGMTNSKGDYSVTSLTGEAKIKPQHLDYSFTSSEITVSGETKNVNFVGRNNYSLTLNASLQRSGKVFDVRYNVNGRAVVEDKNGMTIASNLNGKTVIEPYHPYFDFSPSKIEVYSNEPVNFTAVPKAGTYSVSGIVNVPSKTSDKEEPPIMYIAVDGKKYTNVYAAYEWDNGNERLVYRYNVYGLDPNKAGGYKISLLDEKGNSSAQVFTVTEGQKNLNFKLQIQKNVSFKLKVTNESVVTKFNPKNLDYKVFIKDEEGNVVKSFWNTGYDFEATVWEGCRVEIAGEYYDLANGQHWEFDDYINISSYVINYEPEEGEDVLPEEFTVRLYKYVPEDHE